MPKQHIDERMQNFGEVALGYTPEQAMEEADRCLACKKPQCSQGCPVGIDIFRFLELTKKGDFEGALGKIKEANDLPAICGRVCPQEEQCEIKCVLKKAGEPIAIGALERFVADYGMKHASDSPEMKPSTGKLVAVVGSGPAGLTVAGNLARLGHSVTVFEALHLPGGVLVYGIPEFRLPKSIVRWEINYITRLGVKIEANVLIGRTITVEGLFDQGFNAIFIGTGAGSPWFMRIPGENLNGIYSSNEFLTRNNLMRAFEFPEYHTPILRGRRVAVVGAGNAAMDAARSALRLGGEEVSIVYRRSEKEMPAREEEVQNAREEGVQFRLLTNPIRYLGNKEGWVERVECLKMQLGDPDESGRRRPVPIPSSDFQIKIDLAVVAIGQGPNPLIAQTTEGLQVHGEGRLVVDENGGTTKERIWAAGDIASAEGTVIHAMGNGKKAAADIHRYLVEKH